MRLADKVAIVTGGGTVIDDAIATTFAREGAKVTITGRRKEILGEIADAIAAAGGRALAVTGSVTDEADVQHAVQATLASFGRVDVLVNNAGSVLHAGPLHETADEIWDGVMDVFPQGRVPLLTGGDPSHAAAGRRLDRQHRLGPRAEGLPGFSRPPVRRGEGGRGHAHENDRRALREGRDPLQLRRTRSHRDATDGITAEGCRGANGHGGSSTARSARQSRRRRASRPHGRRRKHGAVGTRLEGKARFMEAEVGSIDAVMSPNGSRVRAGTGSRSDDAAPPVTAPRFDARTRVLLEGPIVSTLLRLATPNVLVMFVQASVGLIETYFVAKLGTD